MAAAADILLRSLVKELGRNVGAPPWPEYHRGSSREISSTTDLTVYSPESALGQAILGARSGQTVTYTAPSGADIKVTVVDFQPYEPVQSR